MYAEPDAPTSADTFVAQNHRNRGPVAPGAIATDCLMSFPFPVSAFSSRIVTTPLKGRGLSFVTKHEPSPVHVAMWSAKIELRSQ